MNKFRLFYIAIIAFGLKLGFELDSRYSAHSYSGDYSSTVGEQEPEWFARYPCPEQSELERLLDKVKFQRQGFNISCSDPLVGKLGRVLLLMEKMKVQIPEQWATDLHKDFTDISGYISRNLNSLNFDLQQVDSLAYNRVQEKSVFLSRRIFDEGPLETLMILVHEARHSESNSPPHVVCRGGDLPRYPGACDEVLSVNSMQAGAYSYGALFSLAVGLYGEGLNADERDLLISSGLSQVAARFNEFPEELARHYDRFVLFGKTGSSQDKSAFLFDPYQQTLTPLNIKVPTEAGKITHYSYNPKNQFLLVYTESGLVYHWSQKDQAKPFYADVLKKNNLKVTYANRVRVPFEEGPLWMVADQSNQLNTLKYNPEENTFKVSPYLKSYRSQFANYPVPALSSFFTAHYIETVMIGRDGATYVAPQFGTEEPFLKKDILNSKRWVRGSGGPWGEDLYLVDDRGELKSFLHVLYEDPDSGDEITLTSRIEDEDLHFVPDRPVKDYQLGLEYEAWLDGEGKLHYRHQKESQWKSLSTDFDKLILVRTTKTSLKN